MKLSFRTAVVAVVVALLAPASQAQLFVAHLDGPSEAPPNSSPATGFASVLLDPVAHHMQVHIAFSGLLGTTTASHIHGATAAPGTGTAMVMTTVPRFPGFPVGVTSGVYDHGFDLTMASSYNPAFEAAHGG